MTHDEFVSGNISAARAVSPRVSKSPLVSRPHAARNRPLSVVILGLKSKLASVPAFVTLTWGRPLRPAPHREGRVHPRAVVWLTPWIYIRRNVTASFVTTFRARDGAVARG